MSGGSAPDATRTNTKEQVIRLGIKVEGIKDAEAWSSGVMLGIGWHEVKIEDAEEGKTKNGNPQIEMEFVSPQGSIRDWLVIVEATMGKVAQLLDAVGIDRSGIDELDPKTLIGKKLAIFVGEEPDYNDPAKKRKRVQSYADKAPDGSIMPADTNGLGGSGPADADGDIPF